MLTLMILCVSITAGCSQQKSYTIVPDKGQVVGDYKITMTGGTGHIKTSARTNSPDGLDEALTEVVALQNTNPTGSPWEVKGAKGLHLSFIVAAGKYVCDTCTENGLPMLWHREP